MFLSNCTNKTYGIRSHLLHQGSPPLHHSAEGRAGTEHSSSGTVQQSSHPEEGRCRAPETSRTPRRTGRCSRLRRRTSSSLGCTGGRRCTGTGRHCRSEAEASLDLRETQRRPRGQCESWVVFFNGLANYREDWCKILVWKMSQR